MRTLSQKLIAATLVLALGCTLVLAPTPARAAWDDNSDELPGMTDPTPYLIVAGVVVAAGVIYLVARHHSQPATKATGVSPAPSMTGSTGQSADSLSQPADLPADTTLITPAMPQKESRLNLYLGLTDDRSLYSRDDRGMDLSDLTVRAGVTIGF